MPLEAQSDEQGQFSIDGVPAGVLEVAPPVVLTLAAAHSVHEGRYRLARTS